MYTKGFTLIELLLVVAVLLIISVSGVPFYTRFLVQNSLENSTVQLLGSLRKAQMYSMMGKEDGGWGVHFGSNVITLFHGNTYATRDTNFDERFTVNSNVSIVAVPSVVEIDFTKMTGLPSSTPTITLSGNGTNKVITVNSQGVATR